MIPRRPPTRQTKWTKNISGLACFQLICFAGAFVVVCVSLKFHSSLDNIDTVHEENFLRGSNTINHSDFIHKTDQGKQTDRYSNKARLRGSQQQQNKNTIKRIKPITSDKVGPKSNNQTKLRQSLINENQMLLPVPRLKKKHLSPSMQISLIGERHSGTTWITNELRKCFPTLDVKPKLVRWKHWFQEKNIVNARNQKPAVVIAQFRNIYDWTEAMRQGPHHSPNHLRLDWKDFVTKPWTMPRPARDLDIKDKKTIRCQENFAYDQIISCVRGQRVSFPNQKVKEQSLTNYSGHNPQYELRNDGSGLPYSSIVKMRGDKIRNFFEIEKWDWVKHFLPIQYETLVTEGTGELLEYIQNVTGVKPECEPSASRELVPKKVDIEFEEWLTANADWDAEALVGYKRRIRFDNNNNLTNINL